MSEQMGAFLQCEMGECGIIFVWLNGRNKVFKIAFVQKCCEEHFPNKECFFHQSYNRQTKMLVNCYMHAYEAAKQDKERTKETFAHFQKNVQTSLENSVGTIGNIYSSCFYTQLFLTYWSSYGVGKKKAEQKTWYIHLFINSNKLIYYY